MPRDYDEFAWHFRVLADAQREGKLVFVLGSGVSVPYGLPDWQHLLAKLLRDSNRLPRLTVRDRSEDLTEQKELNVIAEMLNRIAPDALLQGAIARAAYPNDQWWDAVKAGVIQGDLEKKGALRPIAQMLVKSIAKDPHLHLSVLTFNYDPLLDDAVSHALKQRELDHSLLHSISSGQEFERTWVDAGIYIYHLHGYFQQQRDDPAAGAVLDVDSYLPVLSGTHWSWRCMERVLTRTGYASLFLGLSLSDPSLRYLLSRWGEWQTPMTGVYLAPPPKLPSVSYGRGKKKAFYVEDQRTLALMYRAIMDLYAAVLDRLHLVCYHLSSWDEIADILKEVEKPQWTGR